MTNKLKTALCGDLREYKSIPFWSWNNFLDEEELKKQIEDMHRAGIGGFIMHARTGLKEEYLGEKWFSCVEVCLDKARELNMEAWIYDENGWPSGFVGGKLLEIEEFRARYLEYSIGEFDKAAFVNYIDNNGEYERVFKAVNNVEKYHRIYLKVSPANTDILNPEVVTAFITETHEQYYARFKERFGKEFVGFFTDEPQYFRWGTPYTHCVENAFEKTGEDVRDGLIWLFVQDERGYAFRQKYFKELNRLYVENFYKRINQWCNDHNCKLTGHSIEEKSLGAQMWGGADVMTTYVEESIPAIDWLGRRCGNELAPKQLGSVATQFGIKHTLTETFACAGYDVTPKELKSIGDFQYFNGVNKLCQHLYPYSMARGGKTDHPPVFSPHGNWFEGFKDFNDYFTRLGYIISNTEENCDIAIISPLRDVWSEFVKAQDVKSVASIDEKFKMILEKLRCNGITFQVIDETILAQYGRVEEGSLIVGKKAYQTVLVPERKNIARETLSILSKFDGRLCVLSDIQFVDGVRSYVNLQSNCQWDEIINGSSIGFTCADGNSFVTSRTSDLGDFLFIKNLSYDFPSVVKIKNASKKYRKLDLLTLKEENITDKISLDKSEGIILVAADNIQPTNEKLDDGTLAKDFKVDKISENYFVMDYGKISKNGVDFSEVRPIYGHFEELLREDYKGELFVKQVFKLNQKMPVTFIIEKADFKFIKVNGYNVSLKKGDFDVNFYECDISDFIKIGENEIVYAIDFYQHEGVHFALFDPLATESLRNCLYYDTSIETTYLKGDFIVEKDFSLSIRSKMPRVTDKLFEEGYPFFKGSVQYSGVIDKRENERVTLELKGRFMTAKIKTLHGEKLFVLDTCGDITELLETGENKVEIILNSSLRNLFGPHHWKLDEEPMSVSPKHFEFKGCWLSGKNPENYTDTYNSVSFGLKEIIIKRACWK